MADTTDDTIDQQLKDLYGKLGLCPHTDKDQRLCPRGNESCSSSPSCLVLQDLITTSQKTFHGRKNTKALIMEALPLHDKAMAFVKGHKVFLPSIQNSDEHESWVFAILMLEGEKERTRQG